MARLQHSLSSLRRWGCLHATPDALPAAGQALPGRIGYLQGPYERFQRWSLHVILLPQAFLAQPVSPFLGREIQNQKIGHPASWQALAYDFPVIGRADHEVSRPGSVEGQAFAGLSRPVQVVIPEGQRHRPEKIATIHGQAHNQSSRKAAKTRRQTQNEASWRACFAPLRELFCSESTHLTRPLKPFSLFVSLVCFVVAYPSA